VNNAFGLEGGTDRTREIYATALHEGLANYFACAANDDPIYAEYFFGPQGFANCNSSPSEYNYTRIDEIGVGNLGNYLIGMIWSGALWDIRNAIGPIIDRIVLESLDYLPATPTMFEARDAVLQADLDHHGGAHLAMMKAAFDGRGLIPFRLNIEGPRERFKGEAGHWSTSACCPSTPYRFEWIRLRAGSTVPELLGNRCVGDGRGHGELRPRSQSDRWLRSGPRYHHPRERGPPHHVGRHLRADPRPARPLERMDHQPDHAEIRPGLVSMGRELRPRRLRPQHRG
jgi:hypothetical protein